MDDNLRSARSCEDMFLFMYMTHFFHIIFGPVYHTQKKIYTFDEKLNILGLKKIYTGLKLFIKH